MRLLNTAQIADLNKFLRRAKYEIKHAHPQPSSRSGQTGAKGYIAWHWADHDLSLKVMLASKTVELQHPQFNQGVLRIQPARNSMEVIQLFYAMFDLLGNDDQAFRILTEPYKGP